MKNIKDNYEFLKLISSCKKKFRNTMIKNASKNQIYYICECILNTLKGIYKLNQDQLISYRPFKKSFRNLVKKIVLKRKKKF